MNSLMVGIGGAAGSIARYLTAILLSRLSVELPFGTLTANLLGSGLLGILTALGLSTTPLSQPMRLLLSIGFCGGFTTLSSFICESSQMMNEQHYLRAGLYFGLTLMGSFATYSAGFLIVKVISRGLSS